MIYALIGISGSGKTTLARNMVKHFENGVIISRDSIREMLFGYTPETIGAYYELPDFSAKENLVSKFQDSLINTAIAKGQDIILDNTHLKLSYLNDLKKYGVPIEYTVFECPIDEAVERDALRPRSVGEGVIERQHQQFEQLKKTFDFKKYYPEKVEPIVQTERWRKENDAVIFDIDGTLARNTGRSPYDYSRVDEDDINPVILEALDSFRHNDNTIIICSGRDEECRDATERWLNKFGIVYDKLYMRKNKDTRKDYVVKEEFWREIIKDYHIVAMVDDRRQVIDHARKLGFTVFDVANNQF